ncbi:MAG: cytochrome c3 family protein [Saprospiraceae bacterium]
MIYNRLVFRFLLLVFVSTLSLNLSAQADLGEGKSLFKANCATCHNKNMKDKLTGPALGGTEERWADYPREDLYKWIRNSQTMIGEGHPRAVELWNEYQSVMTSFPNLTDVQIDNILAYVNDVYVNGVKVPGGGTVLANQAVEQKGDNTLLYGFILLVLAILAIVLARAISGLNHMVELDEGVTNPTPRKSVLDILTSKGVVGFLIFGLVVFGGYTTVNNAIDLGRQQGYQPEQPIKFSHATHAGMHKIDCQYCHDGARRSKHSVIPAANTCMNCHKAIKKGSKYGTAEISKIYASIGYDPNTDKYIADDENTEANIEAAIRKWVETNYRDDNELAKGVALTAQGTKAVEKQWDNIVSSLTNAQKKTVKGPIEWARVHNLPDHVYFNHAQHVSVGKVDCQNCHGKVENMEVVGQYAPLSMGWCINCHRQTEVKFVDNDYYNAYEQYHQEMKDGDRKAVTVEDIGGLECQKCHY